MKSTCRVRQCVLICLLVMFSFVAVAEEKKASSGQTVKQTKLTDIESLNPNYVPPPGAKPMPGKRLGKGGSRSGSQKFPAFQLLVPEHQIVTYQAQPTLYWELAESTPVGAIVQISPMTVGNGAKGLREILMGPLEVGIHKFELSRHDFGLINGVSYEWSVFICREKMCENPNASSMAFTIVTKKAGASESRKTDIRTDWFADLNEVLSFVSK